MTRFPNQPGESHFPPPSSTLAITALVLSCVGIVICGPLGLVGVILGIIALRQANAVPPRAEGKGMAIAAIAVGGVSLLLMMVVVPLLIGILLPALGKARANARGISGAVQIHAPVGPRADHQVLESSTQIRAMLMALIRFADEHDRAFPASADDWQQVLLATTMVTADTFISPQTDGVGDDYFYVPGLMYNFDAGQVLIYEDPSLDSDATLIGFVDGHIQNVPQAEALRILSGLTLPDGTPWAPHLDPSEQGP